MKLATKRKIWLVISIVLLINFIFFSYSMITDSQKRRDYATTTGTVLDVEFQVGVTDDENDTYAVDYVYTVNNIEYQDNYTSSDKYKKGETVTVYYNPDKPESSTLSSRQEARIGAYFAIALTIACAAAVIVLAVKVLQDRKAAEQQW